jgi:homoserine dehydrogenase
MHKKLTIGLFGFGVVGEGIYKVICQTPSLNASIKKICIKHPDKKRDADPSLFTTSYDELLNDPEINIIVELIDDAHEAYTIVTTALKNGKAAVSANKKMIATHFKDLLHLQQQTGSPFLYEAAVCGSIPIIRNLEEYYDNDLLRGICGIVNGSTNFILTRMNEDGSSYESALALAQVNGFAETDPTLDVEGYDAANKLTLLLAHAYGITTNPAGLLFKGITQLDTSDTQYANEKDFIIKLTAQALKLPNDKVAAFVLPQFITRDSQLFSVKNEYNGVIIESGLADKQFLYGKGAGRYPTSSAVISDISALAYDYRYEYKKLQRSEKAELSDNYFLKVYISFNSWADINKWDFENIEEFHSTEKRQYLKGLIHVEKLHRAEWFVNKDVSIIVLPDGIVDEQEMLVKKVKKVSLQISGLR